MAVALYGFQIQTFFSQMRVFCRLLVFKSSVQSTAELSFLELGKS